MPPPTAKAQLQYVLVPHPDDEFSAWSLIHGAADNYPVFILLTRGERTAFGDGHGLDAALGERAPQPQPFTGTMTDGLARQRLDSWHTFLDAMVAVDDTLDSPPHVGSFAPVGGPVRGYDLWVGEKTARVAFDLGDGLLRAEDVSNALAIVRGLRRTQLPDLPEYGAIGAAYYNASYAGAVTYTHPDHRAVHEALFRTDHRLPGPQWGRTASSDPDAAGGRTNEVPPDVYRYAMEVAADGRRLGAFQRCYGWLHDGAWEAGETDATALMSRVQSFWQRF